MKPRESYPGDGKVLPFRRRAASVRVRRRRPGLVLAAAFGKAALLFGLPLGVGLWLFTSPTFALSRLELVGNQRVDAAWIEQALEPFRGENLWTLSLTEVERAVGANPWIGTASVEKRPPDRLRLAVVERRPAALLRSARGLVVLDPDGREITLWGPELGGGDLLLVSVASTGEVDLAGALAIAEELARSAPDWAPTLSEVVALSEDDFRLYLGALPFPLVVRSGTLAERLPTLRSLLPGLERRYPGLVAVDLRFERRIVFQPLVERS